ncbi:MAG: HPr family phosphocarrier protein [Lachnospiraceae bacterium]|jgi:phosphotransferase system HPr (HPr) family protein|nr:HPr family phosphocarrier protein [Lachnospiraceae bacterium]
MISWDYKIQDLHGLHVRPLAKIVTRLKSFRCQVQVINKGKKVEISDLMGVLALEIQTGDVLKFQFDGEDEKAASEALCVLFPEIRL